MSDKESQKTRILNLLKSQGKVSNFELRKISWRYPARILDLKKDNYLISSVHDEGARWFYLYRGHADEEPTKQLTPKEVVHEQI